MTPQKTVIAQLLARDPRRMVQFPDAPLDQGLRELQALADRPDSRAAGDAPAPAAGSAAPAPAGTGASSAPDAASAGAMGSLATHVWRTRARLNESEAGQPREDLRRLRRHVDSAVEALGQMGLVLHDWSREPYDSGLPVKVLAFQPTPGLARDTILETVRPAIVWRDTLLQVGEVVVGTPVDSSAPSA